MADIPTGSVHGPYEDLAIAIVKLIEKAMDSQPPEVRAELWKMHVEDLRAWREFWGRFTGIFRPNQPATPPVSAPPKETPKV